MIYRIHISCNIFLKISQRYRHNECTGHGRKFFPFYGVTYRNYMYNHLIVLLYYSSRPRRESRQREKNITLYIFCDYTTHYIIHSARRARLTKSLLNYEKTLSHISHNTLHIVFICSKLKLSAR